MKLTVKVSSFDPTWEIKFPIVQRMIEIDWPATFIYDGQNYFPTTRVGVQAYEPEGMPVAEYATNNVRNLGKRIWVGLNGKVYLD